MAPMTPRLKILSGMPSHLPRCPSPPPLLGGTPLRCCPLAPENAALARRSKLLGLVQSPALRPHPQFPGPAGLSSSHSPINTRFFFLISLAWFTGSSCRCGDPVAVFHHERQSANECVLSRRQSRLCLLVLAPPGYKRLRCYACLEVGLRTCRPVRHFFQVRLASLRGFVDRSTQRFLLTPDLSRSPIFGNERFKPRHGTSLFTNQTRHLFADVFRYRSGPKSRRCFDDPRRSV